MGATPHPLPKMIEPDVKKSLFMGGCGLLSGKARREQLNQDNEPPEEGASAHDPIFRNHLAPFELNGNVL